MVYLKDSIYPPSKSRHLIISDHKDSKDEIKLSVDTPLASQYDVPWPSLGIFSYLDDWTLDYNSRPPKTWWAEDVLSKSAKTLKAAKVYCTVYGSPYEEVVPNIAELTTYDGGKRITCHLACGRRVSLLIPVLASIYKGLNIISKCSQLDHKEACVQVHYMYDWLAYYFKTHYPLADGPTDPLMALYFGEGASRYFGIENARKHIHGGGSIILDATMVNRPHPYHYRDNGNEKEFESNYFMSIPSNYLPLRNGEIFIIEPYNPHRFSRQFGFF
ncbi:hypothetical protein HAX54_010629 [Datura stramonium]|uniref:Uncharacterized protein n=1 Tax=Datura stramonium TaxID=4076 RepID=A0ABS8RWP6_DATST|nr:hypothetical protein [Datura stramonium]